MPVLLYWMVWVRTTLQCYLWQYFRTWQCPHSWPRLNHGSLSKLPPWIALPGVLLLHEIGQHFHYDARTIFNDYVHKNKNTMKKKWRVIIIMARFYIRHKLISSILSPLVDLSLFIMWTNITNISFKASKLSLLRWVRKTTQGWGGENAPPPVREIK